MEIKEKSMACMTLLRRFLLVALQNQIYPNTRAPTQVNTSKLESTRVRHESTVINANPT